MSKENTNSNILNPASQPSTPATFGPSVQLPFAGSTLIPSTEEGKPPRENLTFGPFQTRTGFEMLNASRGKGDKTDYQAAKVYFVSLAVSTFGNKIYYTTH